MASLLLCLRMRRRGESVKILEIGSLVLFGLLVRVYAGSAAPPWTVATVRLAVDAGLLAIVLVSLAIGRPFTLQYARERVPEHDLGPAGLLHDQSPSSPVSGRGPSRCSWRRTPPRNSAGRAALD